MAKLKFNSIYLKQTSNLMTILLKNLCIILFLIQQTIGDGINDILPINQSYPIENLNLYDTNLDVLYLVPKDLDDVFTLNEKNTFGNDYTKGWILPSDEKLSIYLYLFYEGLDERRMNLFINQGNFSRKIV